MTCNEAIKELRSLIVKKKEDRLFPPLKINDEILGVPIKNIRLLASKIGRNHELSLELWETKIHESKLLATLIEEPRKVSLEQLSKQVREIKEKTIADYFIKYIVSKTDFVLSRANSWTNMSKPKYVRYAGYLCVNELSSRSITLDNNYFSKHLLIIELQLNSAKGLIQNGQVNSLIAIGSRNKVLNKKALKIAKKLGDIKLIQGNRSKVVNPHSILSDEKIQSKL